MRFEKWQALGNDYVIVEEPELPFELTPERVRRLCAAHTGIGSDGVLLIRESADNGFVAEVRIYNPDGSEAELSGNGVRQAVMYLRRAGWTEHDSFSVRTVAGEIRPRIHGELCTMDMGRARLRAPADFPSGADDGSGTLTAAGREFSFQFVQAGNPQCSIEVEEGLEELDLRLCTDPRSSGTSCFPIARMSPSGARPPPTGSVRASSSAAWGRRWPPAPVPRAPRWQRCCAAWTAR